MRFQKSNGDRLVIANAMRTPFGQNGKSLAKFQTYELAAKVVEQILKKSGLPKDKIDGVVTGEIAQSSKAPNAARVLSVKLGLPLDANAVCVANNCASGYEAISEAARRIITEENNVVLVTGQESMTNMPIYMEWATLNPKTSTPDKIKANWDVIKDTVKFVDSVMEGLTDPIREANMVETGEIAAQKLGLTKEELDTYAHGSYTKAYNALMAGHYDPYLVPIEHEKGVLDKDEFIMSKTSFVEKPERFAKATAIFDAPPFTSLKDFYAKYGQWIGKDFKEGVSQAAVSLFTACPQSDGAGAMIVTTESKAKELGLEIQAYIKGWANAGVDPVYMGLGMAYAMKKAIEVCGLKWDDIDLFEIHEAFAATAYGSMKIVTDEFKYDLMARYAKGDVNPNGGTLAMGHPLGATGMRVAINQILGLKQRANAKYSIGTICAGGGVAGALILEKP